MRAGIDADKLFDLQDRAETARANLFALQARALNEIRERDHLRAAAVLGRRRGADVGEFMSKPLDELAQATPEQLKGLGIDPGSVAAYLLACRRVQRLQREQKALAAQAAPLFQLVRRLETYAGIQLNVE